MKIPDYETIIEQLRSEQTRIRREAEDEASKIEGAITVLLARNGTPTLFNGAMSKPTQEPEDTEEEETRPFEGLAPTDEPVMLATLQELDGAGDIDQIYAEMRNLGVYFNYNGNQKHMFSVGLSKRRHLFNSIGYDPNTRKYYIK